MFALTVVSKVKTVDRLVRLRVSVKIPLHSAGLRASHTSNYKIVYCPLGLLRLVVGM